MKKTALLFILILFSFSGKSQMSNFWQPGSSFVTCSLGVFNPASVNFIDDFVCGVIDVREVCQFTKYSAWGATPPTYGNKMFHPKNNTWKFSNLGTVFGIDVDEKGDIYLAASTAFGSVAFPDGQTPNGQRGKEKY